jgi:hypothetical protein
VKLDRPNAKTWFNADFSRTFGTPSTCKERAMKTIAITKMQQIMTTRYAPTVVAHYCLVA